MRQALKINYGCNVANGCNVLVLRLVGALCLVNSVRVFLSKKSKEKVLVFFWPHSPVFGLGLCFGDLAGAGDRPGPPAFKACS